MKELEFEKQLISYLQHIAGSKQWEYASHIKTTEDLWENFRHILYVLNQKVLKQPLSDNEFAQVKRIISDLRTPFQAGQFLYGMNGVSQIEIDLDNGEHRFLTVFDQNQVGAGNTCYQVVNQIKRKAVLAGKENRIFDTTLLINGLPIIQIEEKRDDVDVNDALNQMHQYIAEHQYGDIYSTLQILVAMTPNNVRYMANTTADRFNKDFAFQWQREDNRKVRNWKEFSDLFLSIPMAHRMATNYMILDGTPNKQTLKVMRPYQVYATQRVIEKIKATDFELGHNKIGYIWHTTGSGKTITSFKTAWLASRLPNVDKVVFVVDRIALTKQTSENYKAYNPDEDIDFDNKGIQDTESTTILSRKLRNKGGGIIVTSVQKLGKLVSRASFKSPDKKIVFIVDEAHRSTSGDQFADIQKAFKKAAWIGYTGTPMFDDTTKGLRTQDIFGDLLHHYTIRDAIADRNVLGFKVDFETTIDEEKLKQDYLPDYFKAQYPNWTDQQIKDKIANMTAADIDEKIPNNFYDNNAEHVKIVVEDIFDNWRNRSNDGRYNAMLTTHVGGGRASTPMAMQYFDEFQRKNAEQREQGKFELKVAVTFSKDTSNGDNQLETNTGLSRAMEHYNQLFGTNFGMDNVAGYTQDVTARLNRTIADKQFLDIVIVVDQLLTGFDAPELNTLYVDRILKGANLVQAYSRTNRVADMLEKPWGRVVNYRWPSINERLMNEALAIYSNSDSAKLTDAERKKRNEEEGIIEKSFTDLLLDVRTTVRNLSHLTEAFTDLPRSERQKEEMLVQLRNFNSGFAKLKQFDQDSEEVLETLSRYDALREDASSYENQTQGHASGYDYENPDRLINALGMSGDQCVTLTTTLANELKRHLEKKHSDKDGDYHIDLKLTHIKDVKVDYDYLTDLLEDLLNQVHDKQLDQAQSTRSEIERFALGLEDQQYADKINRAADAILTGVYPDNPDFKYPARLSGSEQLIQEASTKSIVREIRLFRVKWGIMDAVNNEDLLTMIYSHRFGQKDLDDSGKLGDILKQGAKEYQDMTDDEEVLALNKVKYRNALRQAIYELADQYCNY